MQPRGTGAPVVPKSQEELDQEREDALEEEAERRELLEAARERAGKGVWVLVAVAAGCVAVACAGFTVFHSGAWGLGVAVGGVVMVVNLLGLKLLLGRILFGEGGRAAMAVVLVLKFAALVAVSAWFVRGWPQSTLAFGLGLTVPAVAGMVVGLVKGLRPRD